MTVVVKRTGTVPTTTYGGPDYWPQMGRVQADPNQTSLNIDFDITLPPNTNTGLTTFYTVPVGFILFLSSSVISCDGSLLQGLDVYQNGIVLTPIVYDMKNILIDSTSGMIPKPAGTLIQGIIYNYDVHARRFTGSIWGTLQAI